MQKSVELNFVKTGLKCKFGVNPQLFSHELCTKNTVNAHTFLFQVGHPIRYEIYCRVSSYRRSFFSVSPSLSVSISAGCSAGRSIFSAGKSTRCCYHTFYPKLEETSTYGNASNRCHCSCLRPRADANFPVVPCPDPTLAERKRGLLTIRRSL